MKQFESYAKHCRTPTQFRTLTQRLHEILPYQHLLCVWGYVHGRKIGFIYNDNFPNDFLRWFLSKGMMPKGPLLQEWFRTKRVQVWSDVARRYADRYTPEHRERIIKAGLQHSLGGGWIGRGLYIFCGIGMASEETCQGSIEPFRHLLPYLCRALKQACPRPVLSQRETAIIERRAMGESIKCIAAEENIAERTVTMHFQRIKKKLYTDDLVNAIVIATRSGMIDECWKQWRLPKRG
ncbi:response regulator transcription factor [Nitrospira sp. Nam74]